MADIFNFATALFNKNKAPILSKEEQCRQLKMDSANDFLNVAEIRNTFLYGKNSNVFSYLKIDPISLDLLSEIEKNQKIRMFTAEFSGEKKPFKFFSISRPVDISNVTSYLDELLHNTTDQIQKRLLHDEMNAMTHFASGGQSVERLFYIILWEPYSSDAERELTARINVLEQKFLRCGTESHVCNQSDIIRLCNLFLNPNSAFFEDTDVVSYIPSIENYYQKE